MAHGTYLWIKAAHVVFILMWGGTLISLSHQLGAATAVDASARTPFAGLARTAGIMMDIAATFAILTGLLLIHGSMSMADAAPIKQAWLHIKLTVVAIPLIGAHVYLRRQVRK